jgi:uncharacterized membrane protein YbhN (UPF0104 family)
MVNRSQLIKFASLFISTLLFGAAIFFIIKSVLQHWDVLRSGPQHFNGLLFIFGILLFQLYFLYQIWLWRWIMLGFQMHISYLDVSNMYFSSNLLAYIPGKLASLVGVARIASKKKISGVNTIATLLLLQIYSFISGAALIAIVSLFLATSVDKILPLGWIWLVIFAALFALVLISPFCLSWTFATLRGLFGRDIAYIQLPFRSALAHIFAYSVGWILAGGALWYIMGSFSLTDLSLGIVVVVLVGSYLVGMLAILIPAGIGITEIGFIFGFDSFLSPEAVIFGAASYRLIIIGINLVSWLVTLGVQAKLEVN